MKTTNAASENPAGDGATGVEGPGGALPEDRQCASADALRGRSPARRALDRRGAGLYLDYSKNRVTDETIAPPAAIWPRSVDCVNASTPCSAARRSTSRRSGPFCTSPCARRRDESIIVDGEDVVPEVHAVLDRMAAFAERVRSGAVEGLHGKAHPQRHQHRDRRLRPRSGHGLRGAEALQRARHDIPFRLERRRHRFRRGRRATSIPQETLFIISSKTFTTLETMTNAHTARDWALAGAAR